MVAGPFAHHWRLQILEFGPNVRGFHEFISRGAPGHRLAVTGLPNFDNLARHVKPGHWIEGHVLACTSDGRETFYLPTRSWLAETAGRDWYR